MDTHIFLARHGETAWSRDDYFCGSSDVELSDAGQRQAEALAQALHAVPLAAIYASSLARAVATAVPVAAGHGLQAASVAELREMDFGAWEGRLRADVATTDAARYHAWQRDPAMVAPSGGENAYVVAARVMPALAQLIAAHTGETVLIVGHKTVNRILLCHLLGIPVRHYRERVVQDVCSLNHLRVGRDGDVRVTRLNDTSHLGSWTLPR